MDCANTDPSEFEFPWGVGRPLKKGLKRSVSKEKISIEKRGEGGGRLKKKRLKNVKTEKQVPLKYLTNLDTWELLALVLDLSMLNYYQGWQFVRKLGTWEENALLVLQSLYW
jgi:hypothetical protein